MSKQTLTQWFPADVKPVHVGVYETAESHVYGRCFSYWDGEKFCYRCWERFYMGAINEAIDDAFHDRKGVTRFPGLVSWRGLAVKP